MMLASHIMCISSAQAVLSAWWVLISALFPSPCYKFDSRRLPLYPLNSFELPRSFPYLVMTVSVHAAVFLSFLTSPRHYDWFEGMDSIMAMLGHRFLEFKLWLCLILTPSLGQLLQLSVPQFPHWKKMGKIIVTSALDFGGNKIS